MAIKGYRDYSLLALPTGWDATELAKLAIKDGYTFAQIAADLNGALAAINGEIMNDPLWAGLCSFSNVPTVTYRMGVSNGMEDHTEYGLPDPLRATVEGHMLPYRKFDRALGWTKDYLEEAYREQIAADIADAVKDVRDKFRVATLTRLLQRTDDSGVAKGLGASGYSPGFATTAGSTNVDFTPPTTGGTSFANTHEHYIGIGGGVFTAAVFTDVKAELREHGHEPPYDVVIGPSDEATVRALSGFVAAPSVAGIQYASTVSVATIDGSADGNGNYYIGVIEDCRVRVVRGVPQYYGFGWKSYGARSQRNPLRIRVSDDSNSSFRAYAEPHPLAGGAFPLTYLLVRANFGVGVGADRTNGTPRYVNNATWADGTPT